MKRYNYLFNKLKLLKEGAFIPFVVLGDPNLDFSLKIIDIIVDSGADALELGIPFSDPIADGRIIQSSILRAIHAGISLNNCFSIIAYIRKKYPMLPIGLLTYANLVYNMSINKFYLRCKNVGIDSILIVDVPIEESFLFKKAAKIYKIGQIFICPPNADENFLYKIINCSQIYIYLSSRAGVTGNENFFDKKIVHLIQFLIKNSSLPILQGFGIFNTDQVISALKLGVNGIISGSAIIKIIEDNIQNMPQILEKLSNFIHQMKLATKQNI